ncbi:hypothetical protein PSACC_02140 [Paramicrosporidium saccamoebae]|uniref:Uncharacterized protein n=1 Tax=Paramicrosporidium saccamoebae TaxID=1246581 RepID=A0A2H9TJY3_9FUNG|nr:hypothetical protein PSACC_02140 [Paramicrosporidium saccamoebae]
MQTIATVSAVTGAIAAGLLLCLGGLKDLVEPSQIAGCCDWFVECATIWKACITFKGKKLVKALRYMWNNDVLNEETQSSLALSAISRMELERQEALYWALFIENPKNAWIMANLPKPPDLDSDLPCGDAESSVPTERENTQRPVTVSLRTDIACGYDAVKFGLAEGSALVVAGTDSDAKTDNQIREDKRDCNERPTSSQCNNGAIAGFGCENIESHSTVHNLSDDPLPVCMAKVCLGPYFKWMNQSNG